MILADTANWLNMFHRGDSTMEELLASDKLIMHSMVVGELAMGMMKDRSNTLHKLLLLPFAVEAHHDEVMDFISAHRFFGKGIGFIDAHLLLSVRLTSEAQLLTDDRRLRALAEDLGIAYKQPRIV